MPTKLQFARNALLNWAAMLTSMLTQFFLSPFTVHHLGNLLYGVWVLVVSSVSYFLLLDMGLRSAVVRFVAREHSLEMHEEVRNIVRNAVWMRLAFCGLILLATLLLWAVFPLLFHIPAGLVGQVRISVLAVGLSLILTLLFGVAGAVLAALHRFDLLSATNIFRALFRAGGFVWLLRSGHGIVAIALWELVASVVSGVVVLMACRKSYPELRGFWGPPQWETVHKIWQYSMYVFVTTLGGAVVYYTDNVVAGAVLAAGMVSYIAIAGNVVGYAREVVFAVSNMFVPLASSFEAAGARGKLKTLLVQGTRASLLLCLPICVALFFRGSTFIALWMGREYAHVSGMLIRILILNQMFAMANTTAGGMAYGMGKHRKIAGWVVCEGAANLILSVLLARSIGLYGIAWGTVIPGIFIHLVLWPRYISEFVDITAAEYVWQGWMRALLPAIPYGFACYWEEIHLAPSNLPVFFLQILAVVPVFVLAAVLVFWTEVRPHVARKLGWGGAQA